MTKLDSITNEQLTEWMNAVLDKTRSGVAQGENPFGAGIFPLDGSPLALEFNQANSTLNPSAHAEVCAIAAACQGLGKKDLGDYWLLSTAEPCPMCMSAAAIAGIRYIGFGAAQSVVTQAGYGSLGVDGSSLADQFTQQITLRSSILSEQCSSLLLNHPASDS